MTVEVVAGRVLVDEPRVIVPVGSLVRLVVTSDTAHEVHVHGVDVTADLRPGQPTTLDFVASIPGSFEVELEDTGDLLFTLQVQT